MISKLSSFSEKKSNWSFKEFSNSQTKVNINTNNIYYLYNQKASNKISFQGGLNLNSGGTIHPFKKLLTDYFNRYISEIIKNNKGLSEKKVRRLQRKLSKAMRRNESIENRILNFGRLLDYNDLRKAGKSAEEIRTYVNEDSDAIKSAKDFTNKHLELKRHMFGYPANMSTDSAMTNYFRKKETNLYLMNSCGGPYQEGFYQMDSKPYERGILDLFYKRFGINPDKGWGYITSGGSESNRWGILNGLKKYPNGKVYFSEAAHYSIPKVVENGPNIDNSTTTFIKHSIISNESKTSEKIDKNKLFAEIKKNWDEKKEPAIVFLTWGTTKKGAIDEVKEINNWLNSNKIDHYIHLDAALYGGIPINQKSAPVLSSVEELGVDSISASFHKYYGSQDVHSIVLSKERPSGNEVAYIGQIDETTAGSRSINPFSTLQRVKETMERSLPDEYNKNINLFEKMLKQNGINFEREKLSNIFVIDKPSDDICKHYQLSTFTDGDGKEKAHIIIFPYHENEIMSEFAKKLAHQ